MTTEPPPLVVVTGGRRGIGAAVAAALSASGARPLIVDVATEPPVVEGTLVWPDSVDVSDESAVENCVGGIEERHGSIDGLVNAAGVLGKMHPPQRLRMSDWDRELAVDLRGTYLMCRAVGARMAQRRRGAIVNIASVVGSTSAPVHGYGPAKAGVINLTATLAAEWGPCKVRVNAISPGFTRTPALEAGISAGALSEHHMVATAALQRLVEPIEVARAAVWLLGPDSSAITGVNLPVDAGFLAAITWHAYGGLRAASDTEPSSGGQA